MDCVHLCAKEKLCAFVAGESKVVLLEIISFFLWNYFPKEHGKMKEGKWSELFCLRYPLQIVVVCVYVGFSATFKAPRGKRRVRTCEHTPPCKYLPEFAKSIRGLGRELRVDACESTVQRPEVAEFLQTEGNHQSYPRVEECHRSNLSFQCDVLTHIIDR